MTITKSPALMLRCASSRSTGLALAVALVAMLLGVLLEYRGNFLAVYVGYVVCLVGFPLISLVHDARLAAAASAASVTALPYAFAGIFLAAVFVTDLVTNFDRRDMAENRRRHRQPIRKPADVRLPRRRPLASQDFGERPPADDDSPAELAAQHAALRRLARLVAKGISPEECFAAVATEMANCLDVEKAEVFRHEDDGAVIAVACHVAQGTAHIPIGEPISAEDHKIAAELMRTGFASMRDRHLGPADSVRTRLNELGLGSVAGAPIVVDGRLWGMAVVASTGAKPLPTDTKRRISEFADLVTAYIAASTTRAELIASRARIVAASDEARRRLERDLHDGAQQRMVSLRLKLRAVVDDVPDELGGLKKGLAELASDLTDATKELQEISRGIHPAVLSKGGLAPALKALANRSAIPASVDIAVEGPVPGPVEVAAYYLVAEALTNAAKHSQATEVTVSAHRRDTQLYLSVTDNGIGGAHTGSGSGLVGLSDRVEALGGTLMITSTAGSGTSLNATIPFNPLQALWSSAATAQAAFVGAQ
jgi:signal transduction histidine kinase